MDTSTTPSGANLRLVQSIFYILKASNLIKADYLEASTALLQLAQALLSDNTITLEDLDKFEYEVNKLTACNYDIDDPQN